MHVAGEAEAADDNATEHFCVGRSEPAVIVSIFLRRLKEGASFADFLREWEADVGFGVPTRVINAPSVDDPRDILTVGFVDVPVDDLRQWLETAPPSEAARHDRIDTVIESTVLRGMFDVGAEHDFTHAPREIELASPESLRARLRSEPPPCSF